MKKGKRLAAVLLLLCLLVSAVPVYAAGDTIVDWTKKGTVSVTLKVGEETVSGAELTLYLVADAGSVNSNLSYSYTTDFAGCGIDIKNLNRKEAASELAQYAKDNNLTCLKKQATDANGTVKFENLPLGLYLVVQTGSVKGFSDCAPFLAAAPYYDANQNGWLYDVDATPKADIIRQMDLTVKKLWNDDGKNRPSSVTIELCQGDTVKDTVVLDSSNSWTYTWVDLEKRDDWSVKEINVPKHYTATYKQNDTLYTVTNTKNVESSSGGGSSSNTGKLIQTGQLNWPVPFLACAGLLLFAAGWALVFLKKEKDHA